MFGNYGFSYIGLLFLLMLFIPNIIWSKRKPHRSLLRIVTIVNTPLAAKGRLFQNGCQGQYCKVPDIIAWLLAVYPYFHITWPALINIFVFRLFVGKVPERSLRKQFYNQNCFRQPCTWIRKQFIDNKTLYRMGNMVGRKERKFRCGRKILHCHKNQPI